MQELSVSSLILRVWSLEISVEDIKVDDLIKVMAGGSIPVDGVIIEGNGAFNESSITGESIPVHKEINDKTYDVISFSVDGNEFRIVSDYESKNEIGDEITIYYDENNPDLTQDDDSFAEGKILIKKHNIWAKEFHYVYINTISIAVCNRRTDAIHIPGNNPNTSR